MIGTTVESHPRGRRSGKIPPSGVEHGGQKYSRPGSRARQHATNPDFSICDRPVTVALATELAYRMRAAMRTSGEGTIAQCAPPSWHHLRTLPASSGVSLCCSGEMTKSTASLDPTSLASRSSRSSAALRSASSFALSSFFSCVSSSRGASHTSLPPGAPCSGPARSLSSAWSRDSQTSTMRSPHMSRSAATIIATSLEVSPQMMFGPSDTCSWSFWSRHCTPSPLSKEARPLLSVRGKISMSVPVS
mmetsp:Transcript_111632/g.316068  ORF Transcript_111632/g.316068 Transcript_111632/m.316068 type:complete len:247 (+) Transcript_111632:200-940(+)